MQPLVSVIIPVYNVRPYLQESIDSVIRQTYQNLEIIIVDDGSTDGSGEICDRFEKLDPRIRVIHQENGGLSAARNAGLDAMHGDYIAFLDSDDAYLPDFLHSMVSALTGTQVDIVACEFYTCHTVHHLSEKEGKVVLPLCQEMLSSETALARLIDGKLTENVWNRVYKRHVFDGLRFLEGHVYEDMHLSPLLFEKANGILLLDKALIFHRKRPESITTTRSAMNIKDWIYARKVREAYIASGIPAIFTADQKKQYINKGVRSYISQYLQILFDSKQNDARTILKQEIDAYRVAAKEDTLTMRLWYYSFRIHPYLCFVLTSIHRWIICMKRKCRALPPSSGKKVICHE